MNRYAVVGVVGLLVSGVICGMEVPLQQQVVEKSDCMLYRFMPVLREEEQDLESLELVQKLKEAARTLYVLTNKDFPQECLPPDVPNNGFMCDIETAEVLEHDPETRLVPLYIQTQKDQDFVSFCKQAQARLHQLDNPRVPLLLVYAEPLKSVDCETLRRCFLDILDPNTQVIFVYLNDESPCRAWIDAMLPLLKERGYQVEVLKLGCASLDLKAMETLCNRQFYDADMPCNRAIAQMHNDRLDGSLYVRKSSIVVWACLAAACFIAGSIMLYFPSPRQCSGAILHNGTLVGNQTTAPTYCVEPLDIFDGGIFLMYLGPSFGAPALTFVCYTLPLALLTRLYYRLRYS